MAAIILLDDFVWRSVRLFLHSRLGCLWLRPRDDEEDDDDNNNHPFMSGAAVPDGPAN